MEIMHIPWCIPDFGEDEKQAIYRVVDSGWMTMGEETQLLEHELQPITGYKHNIVFNSGTGAITAALLAHKAYRLGYSIRLPAYTFKATENAAYAAGLRVIEYGDVEKYTGNMTPKKSDKIYEIQLPVHYAGLPLNPETWAETPLVVEDAAESFGSATRVRNNVSRDRVVCYSFHAAKLITMIEGGCACTNSDELAYMLRAVRVHGENPDKKGDFITRGFNLKPLDICSAVGRVQLGKLDKYIATRQAVASMYREELEDYVGFQEVPDYVETHSNMMFPVFTDKPEELAVHLKKHGVDTRLGWKPLKSTRNANWISRHVICLPIYNTMKPSETMYVIDKVKQCLN